MRECTTCSRAWTICVISIKKSIGPAGDTKPYLVETHVFHQKRKHPSRRFHDHSCSARLQLMKECHEPLDKLLYKSDVVQTQYNLSVVKLKATALSLSTERFHCIWTTSDLYSSLSRGAWYRFKSCERVLPEWSWKRLLGCFRFWQNACVSTSYKIVSPAGRMDFLTTNAGVYFDTFIYKGTKMKLGSV